MTDRAMAKQVTPSCSCGTKCFKCLTAWKNTMQMDLKSRELARQTDDLLLFWNPAVSKESTQEFIRKHTTPQIDVIQSVAHYTELCRQIRCFLDDDIDYSLTSPSHSLDINLLQATISVDEYRSKKRGDLVTDPLIIELAGVAREMQKYDAERNNRREMYGRVIAKCQSFMLQLKAVESHHRQRINSSAKEPGHKQYRKLLDQIRRLEFGLEKSDIQHQFQTDHLFTEDGESEPTPSLEKCGPFCGCESCFKRKGYKIEEKFNLQKTVTVAQDITYTVPKQERTKLTEPKFSSLDDHSSETDLDEEGESDNEDWFHFTDQGESSSTSSSAMSDIAINRPYHQQIREAQDRLRFLRRENKGDTAGIEQKLTLLEPSIPANKTNRDVTTHIYSEYDEQSVVRGLNPAKMEKRIRKHFLVPPPSVDLWRRVNRIKIKGASGQTAAKLFNPQDE